MLDQADDGLKVIDPPAMSPSKEIDMDDSGIGLSLVYESNDDPKKTTASNLDSTANNVVMDGGLNEITMS